jgi:hypothetical protein
MSISIVHFMCRINAVKKKERVNTTQHWNNTWFLLSGEGGGREGFSRNLVPGQLVSLDCSRCHKYCVGNNKNAGRLRLVIFHAIRSAWESLFVGLLKYFLMLFQDICFATFAAFLVVVATESVGVRPRDGDGSALTSRHNVKIMKSETRWTASYELVDYYRHKNSQTAQVFKNNVRLAMNTYSYDKNSAEINECVRMNLETPRLRLQQLGYDLGFGSDFKMQCPLYYALTGAWRNSKTPVNSNTVWKKELREELKQRYKISPKPSTAKYKCSTKFTEFTEGNWLNCFVCAMESRIAHRKIRNEEEREKQHVLMHSLKVAAKSFNMYDRCYEAVECETWPEGDKYRWTRMAKNCRISMSKCPLRVIERKPIEKKNGFHKNHGEYCKRLSNMDSLIDNIGRFLDKAEFGDDPACAAPEHMNLFAENGVDFHVETSAKKMRFEILEAEQDAFLEAENIHYSFKEKIVNAIYDCNRTNGVGRKRCLTSITPPACTSDVSSNTVRIYDEENNVLANCEVVVGPGTRFSVCCENDCKIGNIRRRRRVLGGDSFPWSDDDGEVSNRGNMAASSSLHREGS